jgi:hypothetical protein
MRRYIPKFNEIIIEVYGKGFIDTSIIPQGVIVTIINRADELKGRSTQVESFEGPFGKDLELDPILELLDFNKN